MTASTGPSLRRIVIVSSAGSAIEWYDFFIYGTAAALVFNKLFFPGSDPLVGTLLAFTTFAVGFLARPIGGMIFGHVGDKVGRKTALVTALFLMGGATTLIGLLPTYASIGVLAPIVLVILRLLQGIAVGGPVGRRGAGGHRRCPEEQARPLRQLRSTGCPERPRALQPDLPPPERRPDT